MPTKLSYSNNQPVDEKTIELIAQRVADYKKSKEESKFSAEEVESHIGALSEVFDVEKSDVELIAKDVFIKQSQQNNLKDKIYDSLIKYGKQIILVIITAVIVSLLLFGRSTISSQQTMPASMEPTQDYSKLIRASKVVNTMQIFTPLRMEISEYYTYEGKYPQSFKELGLDKSEIIRFETIDDVIMSKDGGIIVKLAESLGDNLVMGLFPQTAMNGSMFEWKCKTNFKLPRAIQTCEQENMDKYLKRFK